MVTFHWLTVVEGSGGSGHFPLTGREAHCCRGEGWE